MYCLPDAPWIRDAEINGPPQMEEYKCPICGIEQPEKFYVNDCDEILGCNCCIKAVDAYERSMSE